MPNLPKCRKRDKPIHLREQNRLNPNKNTNTEPPKKTKPPAHVVINGNSDSKSTATTQQIPSTTNRPTTTQASTMPNNSNTLLSAKGVSTGKRCNMKGQTQREWVGGLTHFHAIWGGKFATNAPKSQSQCD